jgi:hypothetical protein
MNEEYSKEEAERRATTNLARLLATPPHPKRTKRSEPPATRKRRGASSKPGKRGQAASGS